MSSKNVALDLASFLDSTHAAALTAPPRDDVRRIVERFLVASYDDAGIAPRLMDGHDMHGVLGHVLPGHFKLKDPLAEHVAPVLRAYIDHLVETQVVSQEFELRSGFEATIGEFVEAVATGEDAHHHHHHHHAKEKPVVHTVPKLGRNDPCFCGSGKKFKKCCGASS